MVTYSEDYLNAILDMADELGSSITIKHSVYGDYIDSNKPSKGKTFTTVEYSAMAIPLESSSSNFGEFLAEGMDVGLLIPSKGVEHDIEKGDTVTAFSKTYQNVEVSHIMVNSVRVASVVKLS
jgi:hypothetical protein